MKWPITALLISSLTYSFHDQIQKFMREVRFYSTDTEKGFIPKEQALDLKFNYGKNGRANLETYLSNYTQELPVYKREHGTMVGSAEYNFSNFTYKEKNSLCSKKITKERPLPEKSKKQNKTKKTLKMLEDLIKDIKATKNL